jgi:hypothetical protein
MPAAKDTDAFCKSTLSGMILNYPPPTVVNLYRKFEDDVQWERDTLLGIRRHLENVKYVQDEDLVLIVDGESMWFQLPSDVIIKQYARIVEDANARLLKEYGLNDQGYQRYNQTIIFGADKMCQDDDMACKYAPNSTLPANLYGSEEGFNIADRPARYLNSKLLMGPAKDLKLLYQTALGKLKLKQNHKQTMQSVFTTMFGEQQLRRDALKRQQEESSFKKSTATRFKDIFSFNKKPQASPTEKFKAVNPAHARKFEFGLGLDYSHELFQPLAYAHLDELVPLIHANTSNLSVHLHPTSQTSTLDLPTSLNSSNPPFWRHYFDKADDNPSPNVKPAYIDKLAFSKDLDALPGRKTSWANIPLVQNTYTGSVPAILINNGLPNTLDSDGPLNANITWNELWFTPFSRALLRSRLRAPQSVLGYHNSLVGGDRSWDTRGGRGGVWTEREGVWLAWGEIDGVCGSVEQMDVNFGDGRGVWLHENEKDAEGARNREMEVGESKAWKDELGKEVKVEKGRLEKEMERKKQKQDKKKMEEEKKKEEEREKERERQKEQNRKWQEEEKQRKEAEKLEAQKLEAEEKMNEAEEEQVWDLEEEDRQRQAAEKQNQGMREMGDMEELNRMMDEGESREAE